LPWISYCCPRENPGKEKVLRRIPKFVTPSKSITVNQGGVIRLPCDVDKLGRGSVNFLALKGLGLEINNLLKD
jgi:hypothetical protein